MNEDILDDILQKDKIPSFHGLKLSFSEKSRHKGVCEKNASRKRKVFDSSKQRALEETQPQRRTNQKVPPANKEKGVKSNWREKHEDLIRTIKQARGQDDGREKKVPCDYVQCAGCGRHFNAKAAERHVPWCKQKKASSPKDAERTKLIARIRYRPPQGKSRLVKAMEPEDATRKSQLHSSPAAILANRMNNNDVKKRSLSRERALVKSQPELPQHIIKFKEKFPNHINKKNCDLEESLTSEQLRDLLSVSRISERGPKTVPGVRLSGGHFNRSRNENLSSSNRSTDISRSSSSSGGSSNSLNKSKTSPSLPEVSSSEVPWSAKSCWDLDSNQEFVPLAFYCHQCGSKFPLVGAKYCCECGAKRGSPLLLSQ